MKHEYLMVAPSDVELDIQNYFLENNIDEVFLNFEEKPESIETDYQDKKCKEKLIDQDVNSVIKTPRKGKKRKKYEIKEELSDEEEEKKRLNAIKSKENRDKKKNEIGNLQQKLEDLKKENEFLQNENKCKDMKIAELENENKCKDMKIAELEKRASLQQQIIDKLLKN